MSAFWNLFRSDEEIRKLEAEMKLSVYKQCEDLKKQCHDNAVSQQQARILLQQNALAFRKDKEEYDKTVKAQEKLDKQNEKLEKDAADAVAARAKWSVANAERNRLLRPPNSQSRRLLFVIVGAQGVGKSAFVNTVSHTFNLPMGAEGKHELGFVLRQKVGAESASKACTLIPKTCFEADNMVFSIQDIPGYHQMDDLKAAAALLQQKAVSADAKERVDGIIRCIKIDAKDHEAEMMKAIFDLLPISDRSITIMTGVDKYPVGAARDAAIAKAKKKHGIEEEVFPVENYQKGGSGIALSGTVGSVDISLMALAALNTLVSYAT